MSDLLLEPPVPVPDAVTAPWWQALADGTLTMARCRACRSWDHPPQERCRRCGGEVGFEPVAGTGTVFSFIVVRHQAVPGRPVPYVVALVELDEQPGLRLSAVVDAPPDAVAVGVAVRARIERHGSTGYAAPVFDLVP